MMHTCTKSRTIARPCQLNRQPTKRIHDAHLITNDDGVYSPGITALAQVAATFGEVRIVAPDVERSSAGQSITASRPLTYKRTLGTDIETYRVNGTPSDCVALGAHNWEKVDVVLSRH